MPRGRPRSRVETISTSMHLLPEAHRYLARYAEQHQLTKSRAASAILLQHQRAEQKLLASLGEMIAEDTER